MALLTDNQELTANDFDEFLAVLSFNFRCNAYDQDKPDFKTASTIFSMAKKKQYTRNEFKKATEKFILKQKFQNWNTADFFSDYERPMVYGKNEVLKLSDGTYNGFKRVECEGINVPIWIKEHHKIEPPLKKFVLKEFNNFAPH